MFRNQIHFDLDASNMLWMLESECSVVIGPGFFSMSPALRIRNRSEILKIQIAYHIHQINCQQSPSMTDTE